MKQASNQRCKERLNQKPTKPFWESQKHVTEGLGVVGCVYTLPKARLTLRISQSLPKLIRKTTTELAKGTFLWGVVVSILFLEIYKVLYVL
jgi:hypothetical protein